MGQRGVISGCRNPGAPWPAAEEVTSPVVADPYAARDAVPWQEVQVIPVASTTPLMWMAAFTVVAV
jgi:hypothetical protein